MKHKLLLSLFALFSATIARADVMIDATNFPDSNFRKWVLSQSYGTDGVLTDAEIASVKKINVGGKNIRRLRGIKFFTALTSLGCHDNQLTELDLSKNALLTELHCYNNQLTALDLSENTRLVTLNCHHNQIKTISVSMNIALEVLSCSNNQLTSLDVSQNTQLTELICHHNQLTVLDLSKNTALTYVSCGNNQLSTLDLQQNTKLKELYCNNSQLTMLDVSKNTQLTNLNFFQNQIKTIDVSMNVALVKLSSGSNQLTSLDLSKNTKLKKFYCDQNMIKDEAMDLLVERLPTTSDGQMNVIWYENEQNVMTTEQVATAKAKGWTPCYCIIDEQGAEVWLEYAGSEADGITPLLTSPEESQIYNLAGQLLHKPQRGIIVERGRKVLR